jgi:hypothetical protein
MSHSEEIGNETAENAAADNRSEPEYKVGYCNPPRHTQFKPGVSGNPKGRPPGRPNFKTMVERAAYLKVPVRQGQETQSMPLFQAVLFGVGLKGARGDHRCATVFFNEVRIQPDEAIVPRSESSQPSSGLFINLDEGLLSENDLADLSRLADLIDLGGDMTALNISDFTRLQQIVNKGRGKDVTFHE